MRDKELEKTQKALQELIKVEYMAIAAYDGGIEETEDSRLRRQYSRFRNAHEKQARALNTRLVELGGEPVEYGVGSGKVKAGLWGKLTGLFGDAASVGGMATGAEDGIRIYLDHLDEIHDSKALAIIRRNLEAKQQEARWLEEEVQKAKADGGDTAQKVQKVARDMGKKQAQVAKDAKDKVEELVQPKTKRTGFLGLPVWLLAAALAGAVFFFLRRQEEPDFSDEEFEYETTDFGSDASDANPGGSGYQGISDSASTGSYGSENNA